ncbi:hypothetical protein JKF63_04919 [Porcisia hertigi]|uniref:DNA-directed DNA polymerase n=1 Tax=Porcisia hertigi TaxID=2761500 RepID=A0A836IFP0_9TRYP|nr:hypothetical protein JKF63_04919 [Porcisia hertigi]
MRRTIVTTKGFHAPRPRGSHEPSAGSLVSPSNSTAPPPPPSASSTRRVSACVSATVGPSPPLSSSPTCPRKGGSGVKTTSTAVAAADNTDAGSTKVYPASGGLMSSAPAPRGLLGGHFSANHLRRGSRRQDQATPHYGTATAATTMRASADSTTVTTTAVQHAVSCARRDGGASTAASDNISLPYKRSRSLSSEGFHSSGVDDCHAMTNTPGCAPSVRGSRDKRQCSDNTPSRSELLSPRLPPTALRVSTSNIPRAVFYPPSAEQPVSLRQDSHELHSAHAMGAPASVLAPSVRSGSVIEDACVTSEYPVQTHPWSSAAAATEWTGTGDAPEMPPSAGALSDPRSESEEQISGGRRSTSVTVPEPNTTPSEAPLSTPTGESALSAPEHQRRDYATALTTASFSLPSPSPPCTSSSFYQISQAPLSVSSPSKAVSSVPLAAPLPLLPCGSNSPSLSSPNLECTEQSPSPLLAHSIPEAAMRSTQAQARAVVIATAPTAAAEGGDNSLLSSLAPPACFPAYFPGELSRVPPQQQQMSMSPIRVPAAAEETEGKESDEAIERERDEDLRLSTDVAFTPSGTGSGAPPIFSQSSIMQEDEEQVDIEGCEEGSGIARVCVAALARASDGGEPRCGSGVRGQAGSAPPLFHPQDGTGGSMIAGSPRRSPVAVPAASDQQVLLNCGGSVLDSAPTDSGGVAPLGSLDGFSSAFTGPQSAASTRAAFEATTPRLPSVLVPGAGLLPLGSVAAAAAVGGCGHAGLEGISRGRHRTVFALKATRAGTATATVPPQPLLDPRAGPSRSSEATTTDESCSIVGGGVAAHAAPELVPLTSEGFSRGRLPDVRTPPTLTADDTNFPCAPLVGMAGPVSMPPPSSDTLTSATGGLTLSSPGAASPLSYSHLDPGPESGTISALPARPGRTCFTLHSSASMTSKSTSAAAAAPMVEPKAAASIRSGGAVTPAPSEASKQLGEGPSCRSGSAEQRHLPGNCAVPPQQAPAHVFSAEVSGDATSVVYKGPPCFAQSTHTAVCVGDSLVSAQPELPLPSGLASARAVGPRTPSAHPSAKAAWNRREPTPQKPPSPPPTTGVAEQQKLWSSNNRICPPAPNIAVPVAPPVDGTSTTAPCIVAPHPAQTFGVGDEAVHSHPRESEKMLFPPLFPPPQPSSPPRPQLVAADLFYDLPHAVGEFYATRRGITSLYEWQHDLITRPEVREGCSFIYSLPTSGGKTLVAELSLLRCVLNRRKSCILVLPFVSLAEEKTMALQPLTVAFNFKVDGHYGSCGRFPLCEAPAIYVCTIEKANSLLNHMLEEGRSDEIGAVVVDELHMVGEPRRGATLELFLSKLLMINAARRRRRLDSVVAPALKKGGHPCGTPPGCTAEAEKSEEGFGEGTVAAGATMAAVDPCPLQMIGMSATIPNLDTVAHWLHAKSFECDYRPVPLRAYSVIGGLVLRDGLHNERNLSSGTATQHLLELATEVPDASVLIFCASRQECVDTAKGIVNYLRAQAVAGQSVPFEWRPGCSDAVTEVQSVSVMGAPFPGVAKSPATAAAMAAVPSQASAAIKGLLADLEALAHYEASQLSELIPFGVAFHHGGLVAEERDLIETAFRRKHLRILCCTSTLAAGVNLPARRVIIKTPYVGRDFLTKSRYMQMCGRAGRAGFDPYGESFLLLSRRDQTRGHALMRAPVEPCCSQLLEDDQMLTRSLLECVGVGLVSDYQSACQWSNSLLSRWAVGPVDVAWRAPISAAAALDLSRTAQGSSPPLAANKTDGSPILPCLTSPIARVDGVAPAGGSGSSHPAPGPLAPEPPRTVAPPHPQLTRVPPAAMNAMVRASLVALARCGLIRITDTRSSASGDDDDTCTGSLGAAAASTAGKSSVTTSKAALEMCMRSVADGEGLTDSSDEPSDACYLQVHVTPFGRSSVRSCFSVEEALLLREELDELRQTGLILSDDLHLCYFLTPLREVGRCDWDLLRLMMSRMSDSRQRIASLLGVDAYFIDQQAMGLGAPLEATDEGKRRLFTAKRFYVALMLADVLAEVPMSTVEQRYNVNRGQLQNLMRSASMFSSSITSFCHAMEWFSLEAVLSSFVKRLGFGVKPDLLPLMEIRGMQPSRARALWNAGFKNLPAIAAADADEIVSKVKAMNPQDCKAARFFTKRSALIAIREANIALQSQIQEKRGELQELTIRGGARGVR